MKLECGQGSAAFERLHFGGHMPSVDTRNIIRCPQDARFNSRVKDCFVVKTRKSYVLLFKCPRARVD
jgi:hypothetical protein